MGNATFMQSVQSSNLEFATGTNNSFTSSVDGDHRLNTDDSYDSDSDEADNHAPTSKKNISKKSGGPLSPTK